MINWRAQSPAHERAFRDAVKRWKTIGPALGSDRPTGRGRRRRIKAASLS
jgi:transmembrane sensor